MAKRALLLHVVPLLLVVFFFGSVSYSQSPDASSLLPLESVLNPDGSFRAGTGLTGSLDPTGWHMHLGPHGEPMFSRTPGLVQSFQQMGLDTDTGDVHWDDSFPGPVGTNNSVSAIAIHGNDIYFGGAFTGTESTEANYIVRWDGVSWKTLGVGVDGPVTALAFVDSILYVGGYFDIAGGLPASRVAAWNGNSWSSLGQNPNDGVSGPVAALTSIGSDLYVAGYFSTAGNGIAVGNIARWDGSAWHALGTGTGQNDFIYTLANDGVSIYAGGYISIAGGSPAHYIARWDGTAWHTLGDSPYEGTDDFVSSLAFARGKLYVGGDFSTVGGVVSAAHIAVWDGSHWSSPEFSLSGNVVALCYSGGKLYVSGDFASTASQRGFVAAWDSAQHILSFLANGLNSPARAIASYGRDIYFAGSFTDYSNGDTTLPSDFIARWTGSKWTSLFSPTKQPNSTAGNLYVVAVKDSDLYLGGLFDAAGTVAANNIVQWESHTQSWKTLGDGPSNGVDGAVEAIYVSTSGAIYVGGLFRNAGGAPARNIAQWDGAAWSPLGLGLHVSFGGAVFAITEAISATEYHLYAGGRFDSAGTVAASNIAEWTGTTWVSLGSGITGVWDQFTRSGLRSSTRFRPSLPSCQAVCRR